jgi:hypothetical protein
MTDIFEKRSFFYERFLILNIGKPYILKKLKYIFDIINMNRYRKGHDGTHCI